MELSVIIPVYNGEQTCARAIQSLLDQKSAPSDWEIIAIDDGSSDKSAQILSELAARAPERLRVISRENRGVGYTRSEGLQLARGKYITYLDCDDYLLPGYFAALCPLLEQDPDLVVFDSQYEDGGATAPYEASPAPGGALSRCDYFLSEPGPWNKIMRKSLFEENALTFPNGIWYEDLATIPALGAFARDGKILYLKQILHSYVQSPCSITRNAGFEEKWSDILPALDLLKSRAGREFPLETEYLFWQHLYRTYVWKYISYDRWDKIREINGFMRSHFPRWEKNPLIRAKGREFFTSRLFYHEKFGLIRLWKRG